MNSPRLSWEVAAPKLEQGEGLLLCLMHRGHCLSHALHHLSLDHDQLFYGHGRWGWQLLVMATAPAPTTASTSSSVCHLFHSVTHMYT